MSTNFPGSLDSYSVKVDGVDDVAASHVNNLQDAVVALETYLGALGEHVSPGNLLINGGFDIWQRSTNDTGVTTTRKYVADRWAVKTGAGTLTNVQRSTTVRSGHRSKYSWEMVGTAGVTNVNVDQRIEAAMVGLYKRTISFSAYVYNGSGAAFTPKFYVSTPAASDDWTTPTVRNGGGAGENLQSCADAAWTRVSWTGDVSGYTNINNGLEIRIEIPSGSLVAGDTVRLAEMNLVTGATATPFVARPVGEEMSLCLRYYWSLSVQSIGFSFTAYDLYNRGLLTFPATMRVAPTVSGASFTVSAGSAGTVSSVQTANLILFSNSAGNWTFPVYVSVTCQLSAEL